MHLFQENHVNCHVRNWIKVCLEQAEHQAVLLSRVPHQVPPALHPQQLPLLQQLGVQIHLMWVVAAAVAVVLATIHRTTYVGNLHLTITLLLAPVVHLFHQSWLPQITLHQCSPLVKDLVEHVQSQMKVSTLLLPHSCSGNAVWHN